MNLRAYVEDCRNDEPFMERVAATLGICALVFLSITLLRLSGGYAFADPQETSSPSRVGNPTHSPAESAIFQEKYERLLVAYGAMKTACMDGYLRITWIDPHTQMQMAAVCDVVELGRMP